MDVDDDDLFYGLRLLADAIDHPSLNSPKGSDKESNGGDMDDNSWWFEKVIPRRKRTPQKRKRSSSWGSNGGKMPMIMLPASSSICVRGSFTEKECGAERILESAVSILLASSFRLIQCGNERKKESAVTSSAEKTTKKGKTMSNTKKDLKLCPKSPPENLMALIQRMGGSDLKLVIRKELQRTDLTSNHGRLSIPLGLLLTPDFLSKEETDRIQSQVLKVSLVDPCLDLIEGLNFRRWNMGNSFIYALCHNWNKVAQKNNLMSGEVIHLWSFRVAGELRFALVREKDHPVADA